MEQSILWIRGRWTRNFWIVKVHLLFYRVERCGYITEGKDSWGSDDPEGREEIFKLIEDNNISGVLLISGDRHGARGFAIPRDSGYEFHEFEAASLGGRAAGKSPETDPENWPTQLYGKHGVFAFGEFTFNTSGSEPELTFRLVKEDGSYIYEKSLLLRELIPNNKMDKR